MKKKQITRRQILSAIRKEPLKNESFVRRDYFGDIESNPTCEVCAVGAVLRNAGLNNVQIDDFGYEMITHGNCTFSDWVNKKNIDESISNLLSKKQYLHALSVKFEFLASRLGCGKRTRNQLAAFVSKNFPKEIKVNPRY